MSTTTFMRRLTREAVPHRAGCARSCGWLGLRRVAAPCVLDPTDVVADVDRTDDGGAAPQAGRTVQPERRQLLCVLGQLGESVNEPCAGLLAVDGGEADRTEGVPFWIVVVEQHGRGPIECEHEAGDEVFEGGVGCI
jgi:hypothetical protein